jgi:hypothetical protein
MGSLSNSQVCLVVLPLLVALGGIGVAVLLRL